MAHEPANGLGGLDPDVNVAFSVEWQDVAFAINDLEQHICKLHPAGLPSAPVPPTFLLSPTGHYTDVCMALSLSR